MRNFSEEAYIRYILSAFVHISVCVYQSIEICFPYIVASITLQSKPLISGKQRIIFSFLHHFTSQNTCMVVQWTNRLVFSTLYRQLNANIWSSDDYITKNITFCSCSFSRFALFLSTLQQCSVVQDYQDVAVKPWNPSCLRSKVLRKIGRWDTLTRLDWSLIWENNE